MTHPKAARISPDSRPIAYGAAGLATLIYLGAFATSFFGQASLAAHMLIPQQLQYVAPAVVDLALILFTLATLVRKSRGESTLVTNLATGFWTAVSITANIFHVLIPAGPQASWTAGTFAGAALSALMPLAALGASLVIENVLIARPSHEDIEPVKAAAAVPVTEANHLPVSAPAKIAPKATTPVEAGPAAVQNTPAVLVPSLVAAEPVRETGSTPPAVPVSAPLPAPRAGQERQPVQVSAVDWAALSKAEQIDQVLTLKAAGRTNPEISQQLGVSLSTVKRLKAESEARQLQLA